jgi:uncharacterized protein YidB (DUF937 family)
MDLLEAIIGGTLGVGIATSIGKYLEKHGGLKGLVAEFEKSGFGETVKSWVSTEPNLPISGEQIQQALGPDKMKEMAAELGISAEKLAEVLAQHLPTAIDKASPEGKLPS